MNHIFISYRRSDAAGHAGRLFDRLANWYGQETIFFDRESMAGGELFSARIEAAIRQARVVLVVIGPEWLNATNRERLHRDHDVVRQEVALGLSLATTAAGPLIIPLLCGEAAMPMAADLPADLHSLLSHHAHTLTESEYGPAFQRLLHRLAGIGLAPCFRYLHQGGHPFHTNGQLLSPYFADPLRKLDDLYRTLHGGGTALVATTIHGMGGVGKTQLALKYSQLYRDEYSGVWWFRAEDPLQLEEDCEELCAELQLTREGREPYSKRVRRWLRGQPGCWLLVYDNADRPAAIRPLLPETGRHHLLYTSRSPHWSGVVKKDEMIAMESWSEGEALEFLCPRLPDRHEAELRRLARVLGGLPLALEQACAYLERTGIPLETYCQQVERDISLLDDAPPDSGYPNTVLVTLSLSFAHLSEAARELLRLAAWAAPKPIPELLFRAPAHLMALAEENGNELELDDDQHEQLRHLLPPALAQAAGNDLRWGEVVAEVTGFALAQRPQLDLTPLGEQKERREPALLLHRLSEAEIDGPAFTELLRLAFPGDSEQPGNWPLCKALAPHVLHLEEGFPDNTIPHRPLSWLLDRLATYLQFGPTLYEQAASLFRRVLVMDTEILGPNHCTTLTRRNNLATVLTDMGDHTAAKAQHEQILERTKESLGSDHPDTLASMINLSAILLIKKEHATAKAIGEQVLERSKEILGPNHPTTLICLNNLAQTLLGLGEHAAAQDLHEQALKVRIGSLGIDHPDTITSLHNLALTLCGMGDHLAARTLEEQVLELSNKIFGSQHPRTTLAAWNLLRTLADLNEPTAAQSLLIDEHLRWLLSTEEALPDARQREIRDMLRKMMPPE